MSEPRERLLSKRQYAAIALAADVAKLLGSEVVPLQLFRSIVGLFLWKDALDSHIGWLILGKWASRDEDGYRIHDRRLPPTNGDLIGDAPTVPDDAATNVVSHWTAGVTSILDGHFLRPNGAPHRTEKENSMKNGDRLVVSSGPPETRTQNARKPPPAPPARPASRLSMDAETIDAILLRHTLAEDEADGPLTLHASGDIFRGQVSDTQGYAARMKLKEDGLYEPVHIDSSTVLWRVTAAGRARIAAKLAAHRAPPPPAQTQTPSTEQPSPEPTLPKETKMSDSGITHEPNTWPERPVEAGGTREAYPRKKLTDIVIDDVDKTIIDAIIGRPDEQDLRVQVMRVRRLSPGQVDGWRATRTKERNGSPPPAPKPLAPAAAPPPTPPPAAPSKAEPVAPVMLSDATWRGMRVIEACAAAAADGRFTAKNLEPLLSEAGLTTTASVLLSELRNKGLVEVVDKTSGGRGRPANVHALTGRAYLGEDPEPAPAPAEAPPAAPPPAPVLSEPLPTLADETEAPPPSPPREAPAPAAAPTRHGTLIPEERAELEGLLAERAKLARFEERDVAKLDEIATRRRVRKAKRNGVDARIAELRAKGGIT